MADTRIGAAGAQRARDLGEVDVAIGRGADEVVAPMVPERSLVPSRRQIEAGATIDPRQAGARLPPARRGGKSKRLQSAFKDMDPTDLGGPALPVVVLGVSALLTSWDDVALGILLPEMRAEFGLSLQFLLTVASVLGVVSILLAPAMGYLADRVQRVWMLRIGALISNGASVLQGVATGIPHLVLGRAMAGVGGGIRGPAGFPLLSDYYPSHSRARVFAFLGFMGGLGGVVGPSVAGNLGEWFGWRFTVIVLGVLATLVTFGLFLIKEPIRGYQDRLEMGAGRAEARREQRPVSWAEGWRAAASITTVRRLWYATPFLQVGSIGMGIFLSQYFAEEFGLGPQARGYILTIHAVVALIGVVVAAPVADRLLAYKPGRVMVALAGLMFLYSLSVLVMVLSKNLVLSVVVGLPLGFGFVAIGPTLFTLMSLVVPARVRGLGMQTIAPWQLVGMLLLPFIGQAADSWGIRKGLLVFLPFYLIAAVILGSSSEGVARDIRAAKAASLADEEDRRARALGRTKMLICRDVDVHYGGAQALFNVDLDIHDGEMIALLGTNGGGKSTLLRAIAGVHEASNGAIFFDGEDITHVPPHENVTRGVTLVPGGAGVFNSLSVRDNMRAAAWTTRHDKALVNQGMKRVYELFPVLRERRHQKAATLSAGEQRMLTLAQAFLAKPRLLMVDELSLGLAPSVVNQLLRALEQINAGGTTVIIVEQSVNVALRVAKRAVFMEKGRIRFDGPTEELFERPDLLRSVLMGGAASASGRLAVVSARTSTPGGPPALEVAGLRACFGGVQALDGASLRVAPGEIVGIIGPNGAGKTTLFDVVSGFVDPDEGTVSVAGKRVDGLPADERARLGLGRSFQDVRLFPSLTVRENIAVARERHLATRNPLLAATWAPAAREAESRVARRVQGLLELFSLEGVADKFLDELSTGTRRAVELACLNAAEPQVLLLDEPSSGLAQAESQQLGLLLGRTARETGWAIVVIEHDLALVTSLAERLVAMNLGKVIADGPPAQVLDDPKVVAAYLGSATPVNLSSGASVTAEVREAVGAPAPKASVSTGISTTDNFGR